MRLPPIRFSFWRPLLFAVCVGASGLHASGDRDGFIPFDSRWDFASYVNWRPANGHPADLNPPRFSWPAVPEILPTHAASSQFGPVFPAREYVFQLSQNPEFPASKGTIEKRTRINFENAFPILAEGAWHWRVGYAKPGQPVSQWSAVRTFTIAPGTPALDRTPIDRAVKDLSKLPRPRLAPPDGDWKALRRRLEADPLTAPLVTQVLSRANDILAADWWKNFPKNDTGDGAKDRAIRAKLSTQFRNIGRDLTIVALAHRLTGDERLRPVYGLTLQAAQFPPGGETSPEFHGSTAKWGTQWITDLAFVYDLGWHEYTPEQRTQFREGLGWRINAVFHQRLSWRSADGGVWVGGISGFAQSHPFENAHLAMQGVLLLAGELPVADELTPVVLNYLLGVGCAVGPDGGWNEAGAYVYYKVKMALNAALIANKLLPGLRVAEYPWFNDLGDFVIQLTPPGMRRQGFGDFSTDMNSRERVATLTYVLQRVLALTGSPTARQSLNGLAGAGFDPAIYDSYLPVVAGYASSAPRPAFSTTDPMLPAAQMWKVPGWFFVSNRSPSDWTQAKEAVRLVTMARPHGGYGNSYPHDGAYVWQAYGTTLSAGGGTAVNHDAYARNGFSHNGILVNGRGASYRNLFSENPLSARPLFWSHDTTSGVTRWAGDMTGGFLVSAKTEVEKSNVPILSEVPADRGAPELQRWIRHYAFVNGRDAVVVDDLAVRADAPPARFTWLHHVPQVVPVVHDDPAGLRARYTIDGVEAIVRQFSSVPVEVSHLRGFETLVNPLTRADYTANVQKANQSRGASVGVDDLSGEVIVATTKPVREARFITVLTARPKEEKESAAVDITPDAVTITREGKSTRVTIDGADTPEAVNLPVKALRHFAEESDPFHLPPSGPKESLALPGAESTEVEWLRKDTFSDAAWVNRWEVETQDALVGTVPERGLHIRPSDPEKAGNTTLWLRADAPKRAVLRVRATVRSTENPAADLGLMVRAPHNPARKTGPEASLASGKSFEMVFMLDHGHLRTWLDGKPVSEATDPQPLPNAQPGLHTNRGNLEIHSVEIGQLSGKR